MIFFSLLFLLAQLVLFFVKPKYFLFTYLLYISSFLGFIQRDILVSGIEIGLFFHNTLFLIGFLLYMRNISKVPLYFKFSLWFFFSLYFFGVFYPYLIGSSSLFQSIIASKEFSSIFFIHFLFVHSNKISLEYVLNVLFFFGYSLLFILFIFILFDYIPHFYLKSNSQIQYNYPTILSLFLLLKASFARSYKEKIVVVFFLLIWTIGMFYEEHSAILLTTLLGSVLLLFNFPILKFFSNIKFIVLGTLGFILFLLILPLSDYWYKINQLPSFSSRAIYNEVRLDLIYDRPLFGYGFLHKSAVQLGDSVYTESLSFIDSGYVDLLGKFGFIGMFAFLFAISFPFFRSVKNSYCVGILYFYFQYFLLNITWSVYSFAFGLVALSLAFYILFKIKYS